MGSFARRPLLDAFATSGAADERLQMIDSTIPGQGHDSTVAMPLQELHPTRPRGLLIAAHEKAILERGDLTDAEWALIEPLAPAERGRSGRPATDNRRVLDGMPWIMRTGAPWRDPVHEREPGDLPPCSSWRACWA